MPDSRYWRVDSTICGDARARGARCVSPGGSRSFARSSIKKLTRARATCRSLAALAIVCSYVSLELCRRILRPRKRNSFIKDRQAPTCKNSISAIRILSDLLTRDLRETALSLCHSAASQRGHRRVEHRLERV